MNTKISNAELIKIINIERHKNGDLEARIEMLEKYYRDALSNNESKTNRSRPYKLGNNRPKRWQDKYLELKQIYEQDLEQINDGFDDWQDQKIFDLWKQYILILCNYFICHTQYYNSLMTYVKTNNLLSEEIDDYMNKIENNINFYRSKLQKIYHKYTKKRLVKLNDFKQKKKNIVLSVINGLKNTTDIESIKLPPSLKKYTYTKYKSEIISGIILQDILPEVVDGFTLIEEMETTEHDKRKVLKDIIDNNFYTEKIYDEILDLSESWFGVRYEKSFE